MTQQSISYPQSSANAARASRLHTGWVPHVEHQKHTRDTAAPVKVRSRLSTLSRPLHTHMH